MKFLWEGKLRSILASSCEGMAALKMFAGVTATKVTLFVPPKGTGKVGGDKGSGCSWISSSRRAKGQFFPSFQHIQNTFKDTLPSVKKNMFAYSSLTCNFLQWFAYCLFCPSFLPSFLLSFLLPSSNLSLSLAKTIPFFPVQSLKRVPIILILKWWQQYNYWKPLKADLNSCLVLRYFSSN